MQLAEFNDLVRSPILRSFEEAFRKATGVTLKVVPPDEPRRRLNVDAPENAFCVAVGATPEGCATCAETHQRILRVAAGKRTAQVVSCFAGLTEIAVPVLLGQRHLATLLGGQILRRPPTERDFEMITGMLGRAADDDWKRTARAAYFATPVLGPDQLEAVMQLLNVFAQFITDYAERYAVASVQGEPAPVKAGKAWAHDHLHETVSLTEAAKNAGIGRFHFCRLFKKSTGMTFSNYIARLRVEKAKSLLYDPALRITEVAYAAGFGSIPQFNSVFKQHLGMSPTDFRAAIRLQLVLGGP